ncbi:CrcB protein [Marmoricola sp. OAE513]|uniref:fluoride efflux transporter FluC n=1 Tax=Marmoricola sp. OAE513 TaxID=2817894 RepID=UPI001AE85099
MTEARLPAALAAAAAGGVIGSLARYGLTEWLPIASGFPWTTFGINVVGSALLAAVGAFTVVRRTPWLGVFLGTGILGGFTTMSAASEQSVVLLEHDGAVLAVLYAGGTLLAALAAVVLVDRMAPRTEV